MNKIIPFKKDIMFQTNLAEITSISLEQHFNPVRDQEISGNFLVSGEYKIADTSTEVENFSYDLPFHIHLDDKYILDHVEIDIDDFYYEIVNDSILSVHIDVIGRNLEEKKIEEEIHEETVLEVNEEMKQQEESIEEIEQPERCVEEEEVSSTLFDNIDTFGETYKSYKVYIVRENDSIESIIEKYNTTKEDLEEYNDLKDIKMGDKIIIPS